LEFRELKFGELKGHLSVTSLPYGGAGVHSINRKSVNNIFGFLSRFLLMVPGLDQESHLKHSLCITTRIYSIGIFKELNCTLRRREIPISQILGSGARTIRHCIQSSWLAMTV